MVGDVLDLSYEDNFFDGLIDRGLFHHILPKNRDFYFENILRLLKKESLVYLAVFSEKNPKLVMQTFNYQLIERLFKEYFKIISTSEDLYPKTTFAHLSYFILERKSSL